MKHPIPKSIGRPAMRALANAGYMTLEDVAKATEKELMWLHGFGPRALKILREEIALLGVRSSL